MKHTEVVSKLEDVTTHRLLNILWTKAVGTPGYVKAEWSELEGRIARMERELAEVAEWKEKRG